MKIQKKDNLKELSELLESKINEIKYNKLKVLFPDSGPFCRNLYPAQLKFFAASKKYRQRAFIAANRVGKTLAGAFEVTCHLTGLYPDWWTGRKFLNSIDAWAAGISNQSTKEIQQTELLGSLEDVGIGTIPKSSIIKITKKPGVADAVETVFVKHVSGGISKLTFKSYEQGYESFQGTKRQVIWLDEEPYQDPKIYTECLTRTADKYNPGLMLCTFTPLKGISEIVQDFLPDLEFPESGVNPNNPYKFVIRVGWDECPHLSNEDKEELLASYPPHERDARTKGLPSLGAGAVYPYIPESILVDPFEIPKWWPKAYGLDVGWNKTAGIWGAQDPDSGVIYLYSEHYEGAAEPVIHAQAIKARGDWIYGAIDPASEGKSQIDGRALFDLYESAGLNLEVANNAVQAGIQAVGQLLASGKLKVWNSLRNWIIEYKKYRRNENGKLVKNNDHLMDATRYLIMSFNDLMSVKPEANTEMINRFLITESKDPYTGY